VELLSEYGLFLAKIATVVVAIAVVAILIVNLTQRKRQRGELRVTRMSEQYKEMQEEMAVALLDSQQQKLWHKAQKKKPNRTRKRQKPKQSLATRPRRINLAPGCWTSKAAWMLMKLARCVKRSPQY
jgi:serine protease SohB